MEWAGDDAFVDRPQRQRDAAVRTAVEEVRAMRALLMMALGRKLPVSAP